MSWLYWTLARTLRTLEHSKLERELEAELESHLQLLIDDYVARGIPKPEARRRALLKLGNRDAVRDEYVDAASFSAVEHLLRDVKLGIKDLRSSWRFSAQVIAVLFVGVLVASVMFAIAFCPRVVPGYGPNASDLYVISEYPRNRLGEWNQFDVSLLPSAAEYKLLRERAHTLRQLSLATQVAVLLQTDTNEHSVTVSAANVGAEFFPLLGVEAALGRTFVAGGEHADQSAVMMSHELWRKRFGSDPEIIGKRLTIDRHIFTVIGVMPEGFSFPAKSNLWFLAAVPEAGPLSFRHSWDIFARLTPGVSRREAEGELNQLAGEGDANTSLRLESLAEAYGGRSLDFAPVMVAASILLVISWINVAILMLAHTLSRKHEFAVRVALGASLLRITRQVVIQNVLLAVFAGVVAAPLAAILAPKILYCLSQASLGFQETPSIAGHSVLYVGLLSCLSAAACSIVPAAEAVRASGLSAAGLSWSGRRRYERVRRCLVIYQIAFALVIFVGAGQLSRTFFLQWWKFDHVHSGKTLLVALTWVNDPELKTRDQINSIYSDALVKAASIPGIQSVSIASQLPFLDHPALGKRILIARPGRVDRVWAVVQGVSPSYLEQLSIPLLQGRLLEDKDADGPAVAVISRSLALRCFGKRDPVGSRIRLDDGSETSDWIKILGVVGDTNVSPLSSGSEFTVYRPFQQETLTAKQVLPRCLILRTRGDAQSQSTRIRDQLSRLAPALKIYRAQSLRGILVRTHKDDWYTSELITWLFAILCPIATFLAALGVYGLLRHWGIERRREIAVRLAIGATRSKILVSMMRRSAVCLAGGLAIGIPGAIFFLEALRNVLMLPINPLMFFYCAMIVCVIVLMAMYPPIRAAVQCNPMSILRWE